MVLNLLLAGFATSLKAQTSSKDIVAPGCEKDVYYVGHCIPYVNSVKAVRYPSVALVKMYAGMTAKEMAPYKGFEVKSLRISVERPLEVKVFFRKSLKGELLATKTVKLQKGWNEVRLDKPYVLDGGELYYGYEHNLTKDLTESLLYTTDGNKANAKQEGLYAQVNDDDPFSIARSFGNLSIQLGLNKEIDATKDQLLFYNLHINANRNEDGSNSNLISMINAGTNEVKNFSFQYQIEGNEPVVLNVDKPLPSMYERQLTVNMVNAKKNKKVTVKLLSVNGVKLDSTNELSSTLTVLDKSFPNKKVLLEYHTGEWCGTCPRGSHVLDKYLSMDQYKNRVIEVGNHYSDSTNKDFLSITPQNVDFVQKFLPRKFPSAAFDRTMTRKYSSEAITDGIYVNATLDPAIPVLLDEALEKAAAISVNMKARIDAEKNELVVDVNGEVSPTDIDVANCYLNVWVIEDSIPQREQLSAPANYMHRNVLRKVWNNNWNGELIHFDANNKYSQEVRFKIEPAWELENVKIVAFAAKSLKNNTNHPPKSGVEVYNANEVVPSEASVVQPIAKEARLVVKVVNNSIVADGVASSDIKVYNLDGTQLNNYNLAPGVYIARINTAQGIETHKVIVQ